MKIEKLLFHQAGPLGSREIDFGNDWRGDIETRILFSGPNGCGKSTVLRAIAMLWEAAGHWLDQRNPLPDGHLSKDWLKRWGGIALIIEACDGDNREMPIGLIWGELAWYESVAKKYQQVSWLGETFISYGDDDHLTMALIHKEPARLDSWAEKRKKMILRFEPTTLPNIIFMDAEERRWVAPKHNIGEMQAEQPALRWLPRYLASEDWHGQLEASLLNLKITQPRRFNQVIKDLNQFFVGKQIETDVKPGSNRLRVKLTAQRGQYHTLDELSAGEHQVLIMLYLIARWAEKGCVVLIDEPDLYLHPSLVSGMLARLEAMVEKLGGQLIITSHVPELWRRYETAGCRIELGVQP